MGKRTSKNVAGGAASGGGMNYQAAVTAIVGVHLMSGVSPAWLVNPAGDSLSAIWAESGGPGDDIRLETRSGRIIEIQTKKGLRVGPKLWGSLIALASGLKNGSIHAGVLVVSPDSSRTISFELAGDIRRMGEGRTDGLHSIGSEWCARLKNAGIPLDHCAGLSIHVEHAVASDDAGATHAKAVLRDLLDDKLQQDAAWDLLYREAHEIIERRGRWTNTSLSRSFTSAGIQFASEKSSLGLISKVCEWTVATNAGFSILGVKKPLPIASAWIPLKAIPADSESQEPEDVESALAKYYQGASPKRHDEVLDAEWLGRFYKRAVVVAGPGMGKSTLLTKLAHVYASDGYPTIKVKLTAVAARMKEGLGFLESVVHLGLSGSGMSASRAIDAHFRHWVLLCDGLDECGAYQESVAESIDKFALGHPEARIIVTTRPIGYHTSRISGWRHYHLLTLEEGAARSSLVDLLEVMPMRVTEVTAKDLASSALKGNIGKIIIRSPHMLCLAASLLARGGSLGRSKAELFGNLFQLIDSAPSARAGSPDTSPAVLANVLNWLGWALLAHPLEPVAGIKLQCAVYLKAALELTMLSAREVADNAVRYWEDIGLVERLHYGDTAFVAFVHKSFAEFAAARFLCHDVDANARTDLLREAFSTDGWSEVLEFSASMGLGQDIVSAYLEHGQDHSYDSLAQILRIASDPSGACSVDALARIVAKAWAVLESSDSEKGVAVGQAIADIAKTHPHLTGPYASAYIGDERLQPRLVAWLCLTEGQAYDVDQAIHEFTVAASEIRRTPKSLLGTGLSSFFYRSERDLAQRLALNIARYLEEDSAALPVLIRAIDRSGFETMSFAGEFAKYHPKHYARKMAAQLKKHSDWLRRIMEPGVAERGERTVMEILLCTLAKIDAPPPAEHDETRKVHLSAFVKLSGFRDSPYSDVYSWTDTTLKAASEEVIRVLALASGLDLGSLKLDARTALAKLEAGDAGDFWWRAVETFHVDVPEVEWGRVAAIAVDRNRLLEGTHHGSYWLAAAATNLLENAGPVTASEVKQLLSEVSGVGFACAAYLAGKLEPEIAISLLVDRANGPRAYGLQHVFTMLGELGAPWSIDLEAAIRRALLSKDTDIAEAAATLARKRAVVGAVLPRGLLAEAYAFWRTHEKPYPKKSGVIPSSPRKTLLEAMCAANDCNEEFLIGALSDERPDVKSTAIAELSARMRTSGGLRSRLIMMARDHEVSAVSLNQLLGAEPALMRDDTLNLLALLEDKDPKYRLVACKVLSPQYLDAEHITALATRLLDDPEREIRNAARRALEELGPSP